MAYIKSDGIRVFPSIGRGTHDPEAELVNEGNVSQLIRSLSRNRKSFVVTENKENGKPFEFVIFGFYFRVGNIDELTALIADGDDGLWAGVKISINTDEGNQGDATPAGSYQLLKLASDDNPGTDIVSLDNEETTEFQGVYFGGTLSDVQSALGNDPDQTSTQIYTLHLWNKEGKIPASSLLHYTTEEILDGDTDATIAENFTSAQITATAATISTISGTLRGNADTATAFSSNRTLTLTGGVTGSITTSTFDNVTIPTTIPANTVTIDMLGFTLSMILRVEPDDDPSEEYATLALSLPLFTPKAD